MQSENEESEESETNPLASIGKKMKNFSKKFKEKTGKPASFEDFLSAIQVNAKTENYQDSLILFGNAWSSAGLGKVNVGKMYEESIRQDKLLEEKLNLDKINSKENLAEEASSSQITEISDTSVSYEKQLKKEETNRAKRKHRFLPKIDRNKIKTVFLLISLFVLVCFYYEWVTNVLNHVDLFFGVNDDSFLGVLAVAFWGITCISTGLFFGYQILKLLFVNGNHKEQSLVDNVMDVISNSKIMFGLFVVFFVFFSSSSNYFNNYIGLKLEEISEDEYTISGEEFLEYNERERDVPDEIVYEILYDFDNNLFRKEEDAHIKKRIDVFYNYYEYIGFNSEKFIFKETGAFQGYSTYFLEDGFFQYIKCLFFSFLETSYRGIVFFSVSGIILFVLFLLGSMFTDKQLGWVYQYGVSASVLLLILYFIYPFVLSIIKWVSSIFN